MTEPEYAPEPTVEWVLRWTPERPVDAEAAFAVARRLHTDGVSHTLFGREAPTGRWTYAVSRDATGPFDQLAAALRFVDRDDVGTFEREQAQVRAVAAPSEVVPSCTPLEAAARSETLVALADELDDSVEIQLHPQDRFDRARLHGVLTRAGLLPTDGPMYEPGGEPDSFAVEAYGDLLRIYLHPARTPDTLVALDAMVALVETLEGAFPGSDRTVVGHDTVQDLRDRASLVVTKLRAAGFEPGAHPTLMLF